MFEVAISEFWEAMDRARAEYIVGLTNTSEYLDELVEIAKEVVKYGAQKQDPVQ